MTQPGSITSRLTSRYLESFLTFEPTKQNTVNDGGPLVVQELMPLKLFYMVVQ